ncbi:MAG TPA: hypothetical protein VIM48_03420 [Chthoniobacterales bacterium]
MSRVVSLLIVLCGLSLTATQCVNAADPAGDSTKPTNWRVHRNDIPPRLQWNANDGYCGEVSLISAGLYYGQYLSQYEARICAIGKTPQDQGELLLGVNDVRAARRMHLRSVEWRTPGTPDQFLNWVKRFVVRGYPVAMGVYDNGSVFPGPSDPQYDHIVPVIGFRSVRLHNPRAFPGDRIIFSDNGLFGTPADTPYIFTYAVGKFPGNREQANTPNGPLYTLPNYGRNYGIAILGVRDDDHEALPVRVATNKNYESPAMVNGTSTRPSPMPLTLTVTVFNLTPGVTYRLYRFDHLSLVPDGAFNAAAARARNTWTFRIASGSTYTITQDIQSDEIAAYRCAPAGAP